MADINSLYAQKLAGEAGVSAGGPVGGIGGDLNSLLQNKMFLQFLMAGGQDIMQGTGGANLGGAVQQNIASQNFMKMMSKMLAGDIPEGGKITIDGKGMTQLNVPSLLFGEKSESPSLIPSTGGTSQLTQMPTMDNYLNPSNSQPGYSASDLAGLDPKDIATAMGLKLTQEDLGRKKVSDVADMIYKMASLETKDDTADWKNFKKAVDQGYTGTFPEYQIEMRRAGATTIGDITGREKAKSELKGQLYFKNPDWTEDLSKHIDSDDVQNRIFQSDNPDQVRDTETVKFIENKIAGGGGEVVETKWADKSKTTIEWTVKWSTGDTTTVKYKVR